MEAFPTIRLSIVALMLAVFPLLWKVSLALPFGVVGGPPGAVTPQSIVSYSGYKLFRTDVTVEQLPFVDSLDQISTGVDVWSWRMNEKNLQYEVDVLSPPDAEPKVSCRGPGQNRPWPGAC